MTTKDKKVADSNQATSSVGAFFELLEKLVQVPNGEIDSARKKYEQTTRRVLKSRQGKK